MIAFKGGAGEPSDMRLPGKAGGAVAVRRTLASTICRIIDPTLASSRLLKSGSYLGIDLPSGNFVALTAARHVFGGVAGSAGAP